MSVPELLVFLKAPRPGAVKTRLAAALGDELACHIYERLASAVLRATAPGERGLFTRVVCFAPADAEAEVAAWLGGEAKEPQAEGDLGERMDGAFARSFARGATKTVIVGTDSLDIDRAGVQAALDALDRADVVLRAAEDGGYTLVGLKRRHTELFAGPAWSTGTVLEKTRALAAAAGLSVVVHGPDRDIDTLDDLRREWARIEPHLEPAPARRVADKVFFASPA